ncbi:hypothetical protein NU10_11250 [Flavobacterium dauae]|uniref:hypothetical protein n=1 Tax=Flavobacterium dauae TaxID=1563479 RepID=UPI00101B3C95|nr:hypothetical protein [Flavobacterium dauae]WLD23279.1 hypothetical protein NU10_11250 [Flavobacterium dauae]
MAILFVGCNHDDIYDVTDAESTSMQNQARVAEGVIPFTVENVNEALPNVLSYYQQHRPEVAERFGNYSVNATHVYYKFSPQDSIQQARLMEVEDAIQLTTQPFEFSPVEPANDPEEDEIPVFYAIIESGTVIPEVPHEVIAELHFTDEDKLEDVPSNYDEIEFKQNLMYETRKLAGHLDDEEIAEGYMNYHEGFEEGQSGESMVSPMGLFGKKWRPSGNIRVEEDIVHTNNNNRNHFEPVKQARVNVLKWGWLQVEHGTTDNNGYFSTGTTYTKNVHYKVKFKHDHVTVKAGNFYDTASYFSGSHKRAPLNITFINSGALSYYQFFALIHNASYDYINRVVSQYGLHSPGNLNISGKFNGSDSESGAQWYPFNSAIRIGRLNDDNTYRGSDGIYATTVHELTHSGHRKMDPGMFSIFHLGNKERLLMCESWAEGVETIVTNDRYNNLFASNGYGTYRSTNSWNQVVALRGWNGWRQNQAISGMNEYTPLVIDLVDDFNQQQALNNNNLPMDRVTGYNLGEIKSALNDARTLEEWKNRLLNNFNNNTGPFIDDVFDYAKFVMHNNL